jgi:hypothetical protein
MQVPVHFCLAHKHLIKKELNWHRSIFPSERAKSGEIKENFFFQIPSHKIRILHTVSRFHDPSPLSPLRE